MIPADLIALLLLFAKLAFLSFEITLAYFLFIYPHNRTVVIYAITTLVVFTGYLLYAYFGAKLNSCGCGAGEQFLTSRNSKFLFSLIRNLFLLFAISLHLKTIQLQVNVPCAN